MGYVCNVVYNICGNSYIIIDSIGYDRFDCFCFIKHAKLAYTPNDCLDNDLLINDVYSRTFMPPCA